MNEIMIRIGLTVPVLIILGAMLHNWLKDLTFYKRNSWDFSLRSGALDIVPGVEGDTSGKPISNFSRVVFVQPLILLALMFMLFAIWFGNIEV